MFPQGAEYGYSAGDNAVLPDFYGQAFNRHILPLKLNGVIAAGPHNNFPLVFEEIFPSYPIFFNNVTGILVPDNYPEPGIFIETMNTEIFLMHGFSRLILDVFMIGN